MPCSVKDLCACSAWSFGSIGDNFCKLSIFVAHMFHSTRTYQERLASYWKMLRRIRKSLLTTQTAGRYYTPPRKTSPQKKTMRKSDNSPAPRGAPSPKTSTIYSETLLARIETMDFGRHGPFSSIFLHWFTTKQHGDLLAVLGYLGNLIFTMRHCIYIIIIIYIYIYSISCRLHAYLYSVYIYICNLAILGVTYPVYLIPIGNPVTNHY